MKTMSTKDITISGLLIAMTFVLSNIKFMGSIALDSTPAMLALFIYRDNKATYIAILGHMISAALAGFPLSLPVHLVIALLMGIMMFTSKVLLNKTDNMIITIIYMFIFNTFASSIVLSLIYPENSAMYFSLIPILAQATLANLVLAYVLYKAVGLRTKND